MCRDKAKFEARLRWQERNPNYKKPGIVIRMIHVPMRPWEEIKQTGPTALERALLKQRISDVQTPKEAKWRRILAQEGRYTTSEEAAA